MQWNLIRLRKEAGLTQKQMAEMLDINVSTYNKKETGQSNFLSSEMFIISNQFQKPIEEIFLPSNRIQNAILKLE